MSDKKRGNWTSIRKYKPNIVALGYDQDMLGKALAKDRKTFPFKFKIVKLRPHKSDVYHTSLLK